MNMPPGSPCQVAPPSSVASTASGGQPSSQSAIANAENNHELDIDDLIVAEAHVGKALVMKRFSPRGRGRAARIMKPFSHLTIVVREVEQAAAAKA